MTGLWRLPRGDMAEEIIIESKSEQAAARSLWGDFGFGLRTRSPPTVWRRYILGFVGKSVVDPRAKVLNAFRMVNNVGCNRGQCLPVNQLGLWNNRSRKLV
jgi:hypothetical protein